MLTRRLRRRTLFPIAVVVFLLMIMLVLAEVGLGLFGLFLGVSVHKAVSLHTNNIDFLIVCTGDSHTQGIGAPKGFDYPTQLAAILEESDPDRRYRVVNLGQAGSNSSESVDRVLEFIAESQAAPDLVIFQAGKNNEHNFRNASIFEGVKLNDNPRLWAEHLLANMRIFRLSKITVRRLRQIIHDPRQDLSPGFFDEMFDEELPPEHLFLSSWILNDLERLHSAVSNSRGRMAMLNYFSKVPYVDDAYASARQKWRLPLFNIHRFCLNMHPYLVERIGLLNLFNGHPNKRGYALIADIVHQSLLDEGLLPSKRQSLQPRERQ
ncbi:SGNH/GDSL hydrolase family protein [Thermodesulfobacteriota bacterium]